MAMLVVFAILLVACVYAALAGDRHDYDDRDRRGWWPGRPRDRDA